MTSSHRIAAAFADAKAQQRPALVAYLTAGDPSPAKSASLALALARGGADVLELGVPFSDPVADGPVIQHASDRALHAGTNVHRVLEIAAEVRSKSQMPIVLFSYLNPLMRYGFEALARDAQAAGIDGCLLTDLSVEEAAGPVSKLRAAGLDTVFLAAPTSTERRLKLVSELSDGFVYVVSRAGVTGERDDVAASAESLVRALRQLTTKPLAVGFGVSKPEHVTAIGAYADGVIVGSAIMHIVERYGGSSDLEQRLEDFMRSLSGKETSA
ncbi:MAG TPA: tryptophan synthase subunit alpha [Bryobacteraceae bacterium]|nr:tryptophan synthase subunit alpha [Bryobacteraceae bacterium]